jgi:YidC/Oxa1 family membrane protein insertase
MDRKSIIVLVISFVVLMAWFPLMNRLYPPKPLDTNRVAVATDRLGEDNSLSSPSGPVPPARPSEIGPRASNFAPPGVPEELLTIENGNARYTITSHGGGLKLVELKLYQETVKCGAKIMERLITWPC